MKKENDDLAKVKKGVIIGVIALIALIIFSGSWFVVGVGQRAVIFNMFSGVKQQVYTEGFNWKLPIVESVTKFDTKIQKETMKATAASKDLQDVQATVALNYHLDRAKIFELYREIGKDYNDKIIAPAVQESVKAATAQFTAEELITKRPEVKKEIRAELEIRLNNRYISVDDFSIVDFAFSPEYNAAIERKQVAEQNVKTEQNNLEVEKLKAEQVLAGKRAEAEAIVLQTEALRAQEGDKLIQLRQTEVQLAWANKWNGVMPTTMMTFGQNGAMPLVNIPMTPK